MIKFNYYNIYDFDYSCVGKEDAGKGLFPAQLVQLAPEIVLEKVSDQFLFLLHVFLLVLKRGYYIKCLKSFG